MFLILDNNGWLHRNCWSVFEQHPNMLHMKSHRDHNSTIPPVFVFDHRNETFEAKFFFISDGSVCLDLADSLLEISLGGILSDLAVFIVSLILSPLTS